MASLAAEVAGHVVIAALKRVAHTDPNVARSLARWLLLETGATVRRYGPGATLADGADSEAPEPESWEVIF